MRGRVQIRTNLAFATGLLSIWFALGSFLAPLSPMRATDLALEKVRHIDSFVNVALTKGQHVANDLATLYKIRKLASAAPRPATARVSPPVDSPKSSPPVEICSGVFQGSAKRSSH